MQVISPDVMNRSNRNVLLVLFFSLFMSSQCVQADEGYFNPMLIGNYPGAIDVTNADFNGDEIDDLVMLFGLLDNAPVAAPHFYLQNSGGFFLPLQAGPALRGSRVIAADFNNDQLIDLIITGGNSSEGTVFPNNTALYFNSGDWGTSAFENSGFDFSAPTNIGGLHYAPEVTVGDIDNDGDVDFVLGIAEAGGFGSIEVWVNQGNTQGGLVGTFQKVNYIEDTGPYSTVTALSLAQVSENNNGLDLIFSRAGNNQVNIALNDGSGGFLTVIDSIPVNGEIKDLNMVADDYFVAALHDAASPVYEILRNVSGQPTGYQLFRTIGTDIQKSEKIIPTRLGSQPAFFLSSDFDGDNDAGVTNLKLYGFELLGQTPTLEPSKQCLLAGEVPASGAVSYPGAGTNATDLSLLTTDGDWYVVFNNQSPLLSMCCMTETQFVAVNDVNSPESQRTEVEIKSGAGQVILWLDSFQKLKAIRHVIMPLTADSLRYEANYDQHEDQLITLMAADVELATAWTNVLSSWNQPLTAMLDGSDSETILTGQQMTDLTAFLGLLQNEPGVGITINNELAQILPLSSYAGGSLQDFTLDTLNVVSPVIFKNTFE